MRPKVARECPLPNDAMTNHCPMPNARWRRCGPATESRQKVAHCASRGWRGAARAAARRHHGFNAESQRAQRFAAEANSSAPRAPGVSTTSSSASLCVLRVSAFEGGALNPLSSPQLKVSSAPSELTICAPRTHGSRRGLLTDQTQVPPHCPRPHWAVVIGHSLGIEHWPLVILP